MKVKFQFSWSPRLEEIEILSIGGIDESDYPRFCDAYIEAARHVEDGLLCNDEELSEMSENADLMQNILEQMA